MASRFRVDGRNQISLRYQPFHARDSRQTGAQKFLMLRAKLRAGFVEYEFTVGHDHANRFAQAMRRHSEKLVFELVQFAQFRISLMALPRQVV